MKWLHFFANQIACDNKTIQELRSWNIYRILEQDESDDFEKRSKDNIKKGKYFELDLSDMIPPFESLTNEMICLFVSDNNPIAFKEIYNDWLFSDVYRLYTIKLIQNRLERERYG